MRTGHSHLQDVHFNGGVGYLLELLLGERTCGVSACGDLMPVREVCLWRTSGGELASIRIQVVGRMKMGRLVEVCRSADCNSYSHLNLTSFKFAGFE